MFFNFMLNFEYFLLSDSFDAYEILESTRGNRMTSKHEKMGSTVNTWGGIS